MPPRHQPPTAAPRRYASSVCLLGIWAILSPHTAWSQGAAAAVQWSKVESSKEFLDYRAAVGQGSFDADAAAYLDRGALPQLAAPVNRPVIERVRRRMREALLAGISDAVTHDAVATAIAGSMAKLARDDEADAVVRVNAMLLIGELSGKDGRPLTAAREPLVAAFGDPALPMAVRIAAATGLGRHVEAGRTAGGSAAPAEAVVAAVTKVVAEPTAAGDAVGRRWLVATALELLPTVMPSLSAPVATGLLGMATDATRSLDERVRAAAALGAAATAESGLDVGKSVAAVGALARESVTSELDAADAKALARVLGGDAAGGGLSFGGGMGPAGPMMMPGRGGPPPGMRGDFPRPPMGDRPGFSAGPAFPGFGAEGVAAPEDAAGEPVPEPACRRAAWRLWVLAEALQPAKGDRGLARLAGPGADDAKGLAALIREAAEQIDSTPDAVTLRAVLESFPAAEAAAAAANAEDTKPAAGPVPPATATPLDEPAGR